MNKKLIIIISVLLCFGFSGCVEIGKNILLNSDFESGSDGEPLYWFQAIVPSDNLTMLWDDNVFYNGSRSLGIINYQIYENDTCNN